MKDRPGVVSPEFRRLMITGVPVGAVIVAEGLFQLTGAGRVFIVIVGVFRVVYSAVVSLVVTLLLVRRRRTRAQNHVET